MGRLYALIFGVLAVFLLACGLLGRSAPPSEGTQLEPVPVSQEAADRFAQKLKEIKDTAPGEQITVTFTEEEVTSYFALNTPADSGLENPQVHFRDGRIYFTGTVKMGPTSQNLSVKIRPYVENGQVGLEFEEATLGPISIPDPIKNLINDQIRTALSADNQLSNVKAITVGDGTITIEAVRSRSG